MDIMEMTAALGRAIKDSEIYAAFAAADAAFDADEGLQAAIRRYNTLHAAAEQEQAKERPDADIMRTIEENLEDAYDAIMDNPTYNAYAEAKNALDQLMNDVQSELQFQITGKRPCTHDCSTCGGCGSAE